MAPFWAIQKPSWASLSFTVLRAGARMMPTVLTPIAMPCLPGRNTWKMIIVDSGVILTNLHVVLGADKLHVRFADGTESLATLLSAQPEIEAIATDTLVDIEAAGLAEVIPTARAARLTMNREGIRRLAAEELGLPTSPYKFADSLAELQVAIDGANGEKGIGYPCIVKPVMSSSGKGQSLLRGPADVQTAWDYAASGGRVNSGRVIVEGFVDFDYEITLLTVRARAASGAVQTYFCEPIGHIQVAGDYVESWQPQPMSPAALARAHEIAAAVTGNLGGRGLFGVELFVKGDMVWFSEVSPRPHDTGLVTLCSQRFSEFELHARAILGLPVDTALREPGASAVIYGGMEESGIAFAGLEEALTVPRSDLRLFGKPASFTKRRMGVAVANGAAIAEARERAKLAASRVRPLKP